MVPRLVTKKLGELLAERGVITAEQLATALKHQKGRGGLIGQILVDLGFASEVDVAQALTTQYGFPYLPLKDYNVDENLIRLIPENVVRQYCLIPVDQIGDTLTVAMADPLNARAVEDIETLTHCSVQVFVSTLSDVREAIRKYYGAAHDEAT